MSMEGTPVQKQGPEAANDNDPLPFGKTVESLRNRLASEVSKLGRLIMLAEQEHLRQKGGDVPNIETLKVNEKRLDNMHKRHAAAHAWLIDSAFAQKDRNEIEHFTANVRIFVNDARPYWDIPEETIDADAKVIEFRSEDKKF